MNTLMQILGYWPYAAVAAVVLGIGYQDRIFAWLKSRRPAANGTVLTTEGPGVGTLAEYLKAIADHCELVGDREAVAACDKIAPVLFHDQKLPVIP